MSRPDFAFLEFRVKSRHGAAGQAAAAAAGAAGTTATTAVLDGEHLGSHVAQMNVVRVGYRQVRIDSCSLFRGFHLDA